MELKDKVLDLLRKEEPLKSVEISEKLNLEKTEVDKILKKLKSEEKIISPKRCYYSIQK